MSVQIRRVAPAEARLLTDLMHRSKASWGYDVDWMERARAVMFITPPQIAASAAVFVAEGSDGRIEGFYHLRIEGSTLWLEDLFVEPEAKGQGIGRQLFRHAVEQAVVLGFSQMEWESDRYAEAFYLRLGAERIGERPSTLDGYPLPLMRYVFPQSLPSVPAYNQK